MSRLVATLSHSTNASATLDQAVCWWLQVQHKVGRAQAARTPSASCSWCSRRWGEENRKRGDLDKKLQFYMWASREPGKKITEDPGGEQKGPVGGRSAPAEPGGHSGHTGSQSICRMTASFSFLWKLIQRKRSFGAPCRPVVRASERKG